MSTYILKSLEKFFDLIKRAAVSRLSSIGLILPIKRLQLLRNSVDVSETFTCKIQNHYFVSNKYPFESIIPNDTNTKNEIDFKTLLG